VKEPDHRFLWHLCEMFRCEPDDPRITEMDDIKKTWMYYSWLESQGEENLRLRRLGCLIGSFWNPEAAKEMLGIGVNKVAVSDEQFEKSIEFVRENKKAPFVLKDGDLISTKSEQPPGKKRKKKKQIQFDMSGE